MNWSLEQKKSQNSHPIPPRYNKYALGESRLHQPLRLKLCYSKLKLRNSSTNQHCPWHGNLVLKDPIFTDEKDPLCLGAEHRDGRCHCIYPTGISQHGDLLTEPRTVQGLCSEVISKRTQNGCSHCCLNSKGCNETALQVPTCNTLQVSREHGNELAMNVCTKGSIYTAQQKQQKLL